ncbi:hypothetical protein Dthio_PD1597 [Desulfonatronospira thiodismutans ASO3-1]|uniref:Uncharacterized protein n=1 Tax=Desulfonatronospira thiodismutans ASO3-1 TaxID=555779 RepID=D6SNC0_9BACT|nr:MULTISPECIES: hypothetical protein [Desulfonatronospira]EFI34246.1 hypothetical protein Dthio_PD1597 [Desulfonatronospira thiodismutans ASO3-1]RQD77097.1 MAG: hypothetical protein D5S03_04995 [Desulfonatronospira sp. MSAO_Bac3]
MHVFADGISKVTLSNGNLRINLTQRGADNESVDAGTLIVPASQANNFLNGLAGSLKDLDEKLKAQREAQGETQ